MALGNTKINILCKIYMFKKEKNIYILFIIYDAIEMGF